MKKLVLLSTVLLLSACASSWSTTNVKNPDGSYMVHGEKPAASADLAPTNAEDIILTEGDITNRKYEVLGDIETTVNKTTAFHASPTPEMVAEKLKKQAAEMGADAVINVEYGTVGVSLMSWGSLDGSGTAVKFVN